ncbi:hypothetical protein AWC38_SpisGene23584 [Stylophora pistillata]|uniref:Endonuclease/exonuclease/phosphatase domain-containing protein n=1 Tax=Stylophora pistillata TaxID=50429 RepID=A0A2B4R7X4_STYPI|nr:hypothetical protein AWC38_SpisGene23584 [Stylophora pistillata]
MKTATTAAARKMATGHTFYCSPIFIVILAYCLIFKGLISFRLRQSCPETRLHLPGSLADVEKTRGFDALLKRRVRHLDSGTRVKGYFATGVTRYSNSTSTFNISGLINCGDVELNPGPDQPSSTTRKNLVWKFPCKLFMLNVRSPRNKIDDVTALLLMDSFDIVALTETWLSDDFSDSELQLDGYNNFAATDVTGEEDLRTNPKKFWSFHSLKSKARRIPPIVTYRLGSASDPAEKAFLFNECFSSVFTSLSVDHATLRNNVTHPDLSMNVSTSALEVRLGGVPQEWKTANITPVLKSDNKTMAENYGSVSLLCVPSKYQEKIIHNAIFQRVAPYLHDWQHGFIKGRSCVTGVNLRDVDFMKPPPAGNVDPKIEAAMKELVDRYRPVRQRTVRSETTKDKAGALPPAVYSSMPLCTAVTFQEDVQDNPGTGNEERVDQDTDIPRAIDEVPRITFVDESILGVVAVVAVDDVTDLPEQEDEFDTESEGDADNDTDIAFSRFGRAIRAHFCLNL